MAAQPIIDPTGNWAGFDQDDDGDNNWDLEQSRTHSKVNEGQRSVLRVWCPCSGNTKI